MNTLTIAKPTELVEILASHSEWTEQVLNEVKDKDQKRGVYKSFKKLSSAFLEELLVNLEIGLEKEINSRALVKVLNSC